MEQTFGERVRFIRRRRGMTQADLARALGCTVQTVVRYEGLRLEEVKPAKVKEIAAALKVDEAELTGGAPDEEERQINILTRGLRKMSPEQRESVVKLVMAFMDAHQLMPDEEDGEDDEE